MKDAVQEQLIAARRHQILDAAARVFAEKGFHPTTIKDIARAAGIADGTIYNYFENKTALLLGILERMRETAVQDEALASAGELDLRGFLIAYLRQPLMALKADNFALFRVIMSEIVVNPELRAVYEEQILEPTLAMAEAQFRQLADQQAIRPIRIDLAIRTLSGVVLGLILERIMGDETLESNWDELPEFLADLILEGLKRSSTDS